MNGLRLISTVVIQVDELLKDLTDAQREMLRRVCEVLATRS